MVGLGKLVHCGEILAECHLVPLADFREAKRAAVQLSENRLSTNSKGGSNLGFANFILGQIV